MSIQGVIELPIQPHVRRSLMGFLVALGEAASEEGVIHSDRDDHYYAIMILLIGSLVMFGRVDCGELWDEVRASSKPVGEETFRNCCNEVSLGIEIWSQQTQASGRA